MKPSRPVRTLLVDDARLDLVILQRILSKSPEIEVVAVARNGAEALERARECSPDVICTDLQMPVMDGLTFTQEIMSSERPRPILVLSSQVGDRSSETVFDLLNAGAVDVMLKPAGGLSDPQVGEDLIDKIKLLSGVSVLRRHKRVDRQTLSAKAQKRPTSTVVIGASTGGPPVLLELLKGLSSDFPAPILVVQHISPGFLGGLTRWLDTQCALNIREMTDGERSQPGTVYFPVEDHHMEVGMAGRLVASKADPWRGHRPSVNVTLHSVVQHCGREAVGLLMTGMGEDGAEGLLALKEAGGETIAQDEASSVVFGMAARAIALGAAQHVLPTKKIAERLAEIETRGKR